jgi:hypothetical protein
LIESRTTRRFWRLFDSLPVEVRRDAREAYGLFRINPWHPSLHFKRLEGEDLIYSVRIGLGYRALGVMKKNRVIWYWIGSHAEYDRLA